MKTILFLLALILSACSLNHIQSINFAYVDRDDEGQGLIYCMQGLIDKKPIPPYKGIIYDVRFIKMPPCDVSEHKISEWGFYSLVFEDSNDGLWILPCEAYVSDTNMVIGMGYGMSRKATTDFIGRIRR